LHANLHSNVYVWTEGLYVDLYSIVCVLTKGLYAKDYTQRIIRRFV